MSGGGGTTTSNSSSTVPPDVLAEYNKVVAQANQVAATPLQQYSGQIVAGLNPTETSAFNTIDNMQGITAPYTSAASNLIGSATQNINPNTVTAGNIQNYESPYTHDVLQAAIAAQNNQDAQQQQQLTGDAISAGAWGGDRAGVAQGILGGQQAIANNATNAGILNQGYAQAVQEANEQQAASIQAQEVSQQLQLSGGLAQNQLGLSAQQAGLTGANAQLASGQVQQQQTQAGLNVPYEQFLQQQAYPFQTTGWLGNIAEGIGSNEGGTSTSSTTQPSQGLFGFKRGGGIVAGNERSSGGIVPRRAFGGKLLPDVLSIGGDIIGAFFGDPMAGSQATGMLNKIDGGKTDPGVQPSDIFNMNRGGIVPQHFEDGGSDDSNARALEVLDPDGSPDNQVRDYSAPAGGIAPPPTPPVNAPDHPNNMGYEAEMPTPHEANPWLSVAAGVLGTLAGRSRNPLIDIGQGGLIGLNNYAQQQAQAEKMNYEEGNFHQNAQKLMDERADVQQTFANEKQKESDLQEYRKNETENQATHNNLLKQQIDQGKVGINTVTGKPYWTSGPNVGKPIPNTEDPITQEYANNIGVPLRTYQSRKDTGDAADIIKSSNDIVAPISDSILSLQRVKNLLPQIDQGKMSQYSRSIQKLMGEGSTEADAIGKVIPGGTTERAAYEELSKLEGNAALQNEVAQGIKGRALGFNMVKLGQGLFANPEMAKDAQSNILDKALYTAQMAKNANEVVQPFEGHSTGTLNQVKQKYYNDSIAAGYAIPTNDYLSGAWKQPGYKPPGTQQVYSTSGTPMSIPPTQSVAVPGQPASYKHLWGDRQ